MSDADGTLELPAADQVAAANLAPGSMIGRFVIRSRLGEGGMGIVLAGEDPDLGRPVAIKLVRSDVDHPAYRARLLREAQAMARIEHRNVVRVYEVGTDRGRLYVAMELIDGVTLSTWLRVQRRTWREVVAVFTQIGEGLAVVHRAGFVHRDFKPDNVLVDRDGRAHVADFGLARVDPDRISASVSPDLAASLTHTGMALGTPGYMAPEQQLGGDVDARADQYSYCVALREALLGGRQINPDGIDWGTVPRAARAVIARGLAYDASERFASLDDLLVALGRIGSRRGVVLGSVVAAVVLGIAIVAWTRMHGEAVDPAPSVAPVIATQPPLDASPVNAVADAAIVAAVVVAPDADAPSPPKHVGSGSAVAAVKPSPPLVPGSNDATAKGMRHEMLAAHRAAVRDAVRELGYVGLTFTGDDLELDLRETRTKLAAATTELDRGMLLHGIAAAERKRGDCTAAQVAWVQARKALVAATHVVLDATAETRRNQAFRFLGRTMVGQAMCELADGQALAAEKLVENGIRSLFGVGEQERAEAQLAWALALWETGEETQGKELVIIAGRHGDERLRATIEAYLQATGQSLR